MNREGCTEIEYILGPTPTESGEHTLHTQLHESKHAEKDWKSLRPYFGWQSEQVIQDTYKVTVELWVISFLEISHIFPLVVVDINELSYPCRSKRAVYRPC